MEDEELKKRCLIPITFEALEFLLSIPKEAKIKRIFQSDQSTFDHIYIEVEGIGWPVRSGGIIPKSYVTLLKREDGGFETKVNCDIQI